VYGEAAQHAILARFVDSYRLKDLNSTNGTQVNVPPAARPSSKPRGKETRPSNNRSFFFGGNGEQNPRCGNPKNCSKESGFHVGKQAETIVPSSQILTNRCPVVQ